MSQEERTKLQESVPYVKIYRYNPKHLYSKLNGYGDDDDDDNNNNIIIIFISFPFIIYRCSTTDLEVVIKNTILL